MSALLALTGHSLRRRRWFIVAECAVLFVFQLVAVAAAGEVQRSNGFDAFSVLLPSFMREWASVMMASYGALSLVGYSHPIVMLLLVATAISIATELVEETETRFVDLTMSRPVPRATPVNRSMLVIALVVAMGVGSMLLGTGAGLTLLRPDNAPLPAARTIASLAGGLSLVVLAWGALALAISALSVRRAAAGGVAGLLAATMFILALLGEFWSVAAPWALVSPFDYFQASRIVGGAGLHLRDVAVLLGFATAGFVTAHIAYRRRDL